MAVDRNSTDQKATIGLFRAYSIGGAKYGRSAVRQVSGDWLIVLFHRLRIIVLLRRHILVPALLSSTTMFVVSWLWHGLALTDLEELTIPKTLYFCLAGLVYLMLGLGMTFAIHTSIQHEWISLKRAFPFTSMLLGAAMGFFVYLVIFVLGMSFTKSGMVHVVVDVLWQMLEQGLGGLAVSLGIIYDMHKRYLESERA